MVRYLLMSRQVTLLSNVIERACLTLWPAVQRAHVLKFRRSPKESLLLKSRHLWVPLQRMESGYKLASLPSFPSSSLFYQTFQFLSFDNQPNFSHHAPLQAHAARLGLLLLHLSRCPMCSHQEGRRLRRLQLPQHCLFRLSPC